jgi:acetyl esterase/lipase
MSRTRMYIFIRGRTACRISPVSWSSHAIVGAQNLYGIVEIIPQKLIALEVFPERGGSYGVTKSWMSYLFELTTGADRQEFAVKWIGERSDRLALARELSPIHHVHRGSVPVVTIHGDQDLIVPYAQAVRFHDALTREEVLNELVTLRGSGHAFDAAASLSAYRGIFRFLASAGVSLGSRDRSEQ